MYHYFNLSYIYGMSPRPYLDVNPVPSAKMASEDTVKPLKSERLGTGPKRSL